MDVKNIRRIVKSGLVEAVKRIAPGMLWRYRLRSLTRSEHEIELRLLPYLCDKTKTSIDIGAAAGIFSAHLFPVSRDCVAFEPRPIQGADLQAMFAGARAAVRVELVALSDRTGVAKLRVLMEDMGRSTIETENLLVDEDGSPCLEIQVPVRRLDDYEFKDIGFIKIDVEGHELAVLKGAHDTIVRERPTLLVEIEDRHKPNAVFDVRTYLENLEFLGFFILENSLEPIAKFCKEIHQNPAHIGGWKSGWARRGIYVNNFLFLPKEREGAISHAALNLGMKVSEVCF